MNSENQPADESAFVPARNLPQTELDSGTHGGPISRNLLGHRVPPWIPDHELLRVIGRGAYGEVWLARNVMGTYRAVKIVYRDSFDNDRPYEREYSGIQRFEPISRSHECQVDILHVGRDEANAYFYYIMELADAEDGGGEIDPETYVPKTVRSELKRRGRFPFAEALEISLGLATALEHLRKNGLVHRDIKPANVIFVNGLPKLADIGLVTESGGPMSYVGTEGYLPPEGPGSIQADIYSLGKTLYEIATGRDRQEFPELPTITESRPEEDALFELNEILLKACHPDVSQRYQDAEGLHRDLVLLQVGKSIRRSHALEKRIAFFAKASFLSLLFFSLAVAGYLYQQAQTREARRLAVENRELALKESQQRHAAEAAVRLHELQKIDQMMEMGRSGKALALLAHRVRAKPEDAFATRQLLSALMYRNFALPLGVLRCEAEIFGADISPDGRFLVTGTVAGDVFFYALESGRLLGHERLGDRIHSVRFHPRANRVMVAGYGANMAVIWDIAQEPRLVREIPHAAPVSHAEFSPDGNRIVTTETGGKAYLRDAETGELQLVLEHDESNLEFGRFTSDGKHLITATYNTIFAWDSSTGELLGRHEDPSFWGERRHNRKNPITLSPAGPYVAYQKGGKQAKIWNFVSGKTTASDQVHRAPIGAVVFSPGGRMLATGSNDQNVRIFNRGTGLTHRFDLNHRGIIKSVVFSPNGETLASGAYEGTIRIWDCNSGEQIVETMHHPGTVKLLQFTPDGRTLVSVGEKSVSMWNIQSGVARPSLMVDEECGYARNFVSFLTFDPSGERLISTSHQTLAAGPYLVKSGTQRLFPVYGRRWHWKSNEPGPARIRQVSCPGNLRISADHTLALSAIEGGVLLWDTRTGKEIRRIETGDKSKGFTWWTNRDRRIWMSPHAAWAITLEGQGPAKLWNLKTGALLRELDQISRLRNVAFTSDEERYYTQSSDNGIQLWNLASGELLESREGTLAWYNPKTEFAVVHRGNPPRLQFQEVTSGKPASDWFTHDQAITSWSLSDDERWLVTASFDQTAKIWEVASGRQVAPNLHHDWAIHAAGFSPSAEEVATGSWDTTARVWDRASGLPLTEPLRHWDIVLTLAFHPSGRWLATGSADGLTRIWEVPQAPGPAPKWLPDLAEAMAGCRVTDLGNFEKTAGQEPFNSIRKQLAAGAGSGMGEEYYDRWIRWFFADREHREISPSSSVNLDIHRDRLEEINFVGLSPDAAPAALLKLAPMEPRYLARMGHKLVSEANIEGLSKPKLLRADWLTRLAVRLTPESALAWWARAEVLHEAGQSHAAALAIRQALELDPGDPNAWMVRAFIRHRAGESVEAYEDFKKAVQITTSWLETPPRNRETYIDDTLYAMAVADISDADALKAWGDFFGRPQASDRSRLVGDWQSALVVEQASPENVAKFRATRLDYLKNSGLRGTPIVDQPRQLLAQAGEDVELWIKTYAPETLSYAWEHQDRLLEFTSTENLVLTNIQPENAGVYRVTVNGIEPSSRYYEASRDIHVQVEKEDWIYGSLQCEIWRDVPDVSLEGFFLGDGTLNAPDQVDRIGSAELQSHGMEHFAARIFGWLMPPEDGQYRFYFLSDDAGILRLSSDAAPENAEPIAFENEWNEPRLWENAVNEADKGNRSEWITLEKGKPRYIEALMRQGGGPSYLGIAWQRPGDPPPKNGDFPIPGEFFARPATSEITLAKP